MLMSNAFLQQVMLSMLRHLITLGCGYLVAKGYITESLQEQIIGGVGAVFAMVWGAGQKAGNGGLANMLRAFADKIDPPTVTPIAG